MSGPPPPPRRRHVPAAEHGAGSAFNAVKQKQRQSEMQQQFNPVIPSKPRPNHQGQGIAPPRYQQIVTSESGQLNFGQYDNQDGNGMQETGRT